MDITGFITIVPEAPADALFQSFVVGAPVVNQHDGASLANEWQTTIAKVGVKDARKLSAICTDGQYFQIGAPSKFVADMVNAQDDLAARSERPSVPCLWDGAHLDLADSSARGDRSCAWVNETIETVTRIITRFSTSTKNRERLTSISKERSLPLKGLKLWSDTRFSPYAASVLEAFVVNMPVLAAGLDQLADSPREKSSVVKEMEEELRLLKGM